MVMKEEQMKLPSVKGDRNLFYFHLQPPGNGHVFLENLYKNRNHTIEGQLMLLILSGITRIQLQ
jgi:hypothetical protein